MSLKIIHIEIPAPKKDLKPFFSFFLWIDLGVLEKTGGLATTLL